MPRLSINKGIVAADVRGMDNAAIVAARVGCPLEWSINVSPAREVPDTERPRLLADVKSRIVQRLHRHEARGVVSWVRERKLIDDRRAGEHVHGLLWLPVSLSAGEVLRAITGRNAERRGDKWISEDKFKNVLIEPNDGRRGTFDRLRYLGKECDGQYQGWLIRTGRIENAWRWERPAPILGERVSFSNDLVSLIEADADRRPKFYAIAGERKQVEAASPGPAPVRIVVSNPLVPDPVQLSLFPLADRPVSRLAHFAGHVLPAAVALEVEARRRWRGLTQAQLAEQIGISRPQLVNVLKGRFPLSQWAAGRLREFMLANGESAAQRGLEPARAA